MNTQEYFSAQRKLPIQRDRLRLLESGHSDYEKSLAEFLESLIAVKGHAWCMDVKRERRKMAKLIAGESACSKNQRLI